MTIESDHIRIEALIRRWVKAVREGNRAAIRADHDSAMLMFGVSAPLSVRGLDAYMHGWESHYGAWNELQSFTCDDLQITNGPDVAFATAIARSSSAATPGAMEALEFRLTMGLRKIDGRWLVVHEHHSVPARAVAAPVPGTREAQRLPVPTLDPR